jgi:hypothetical protein
LKLIFKLSTQCIVEVNHSLLFQPNAHNLLNTYNYHHLPPTCYDFRYTIFRETIALLAQRLFACCSVVIKCKIHSKLRGLSPRANCKIHTFLKFAMLLQCLKRSMHIVENFNIIDAQESKLINNYRDTKIKLLKNKFSNMVQQYT